MEPATSTIVTPEIIIPAIVFPTPDIVTPDNRGKYRNFTASFKLAAVEEATITSIRAVGRKYNVNESTVRVGIIKRETERY